MEGIRIVRQASVGTECCVCLNAVLDVSTLARRSARARLWGDTSGAAARQEVERQRAQVRLLPCRHANVCWECYALMHRGAERAGRTLTCPNCREDVDSWEVLNPATGSFQFRILH